MKRLMILASCAGLALAGCATTQDDANKNTKQDAAIGAAGGAVLGALIGYSQDRSGGALRGALIGGAVGGAAGAGVGYYMDKQEAEFKQQLAAEQAAHEVEVQRLKNENLKITMNSEVSFDFNSAAIKPAFDDTLNKVSDILSRYNRTTVKVIGFTDNVGSGAYNQKLSDRRAQSVAYYIEDHGVDANRVQPVGRGEMEPRATNATEAGRQLNRRVELLIIPDKDIQ
ncbi:MAG TPA: OmpA family protein [Mariprofundaceae bacterium]|nr:OmpA family protein [Mariprofundaceae bacterium]